MWKTSSSSTTKYFKGGITWIIRKPLQKIEEEGLPNLLIEANFILLPKSDKDIIRKQQNNNTQQDRCQKFSTKY
jgi:hypothetical protein